MENILSPEVDPAPTTSMNQFNSSPEVRKQFADACQLFFGKECYPDETVSQYVNEFGEKYDKLKNHLVELIRDECLKLGMNYDEIVQFISPFYEIHRGYNRYFYRQI